MVGERSQDLEPRKHSVDPIETTSGRLRVEMASHHDGTSARIGSLARGENIADLGGVIMCYEAFKKTGQFKNREVVAGLNPDQRYFLGYALGWMVNIRPEAIANQVRSDEHSPAKFRVNGPLSNIPDFYATFNVKPGNAMWTPDSLRVEIW